jgi:DNA-binding NarL/FixJ family response regulator
MRHANPKAVTILLSAFPETNAATHAILLQADQILVKPMDVTALVSAIKESLSVGAPVPRVVEAAATILDRASDVTIKDWFLRATHLPLAPGSSRSYPPSPNFSPDRQQRVDIGLSG